MIIAFHLFSIYFPNCLRKMKIYKTVNSSASAFHDAESNVHFDPPVYQQRYNEVQNILLSSGSDADITTVVDFGCSELGFFKFLKKLNNLQHVFCVDIDLNLLESCSYKILPLSAEYLNTVRTRPFSVSLLNGSIADPDYRIIGVDAVIGIEIIEHLYPDTLDAVPYNIFGIIYPRIAVFTTPNSEFNVLFHDFNKFRHYDHKFEWTRQQFQDWSHNIISRYTDYSVRFYDIGPGPPGSDHLGCCSQMAIFELKSDRSTNELMKELTKKCKCFSYDEDKQNADELKKCNCNLDFSSFGICTYHRYSADVARSKSNCELEKDEDFLCSRIKYCKCDFYNVIEKVEYPFKKDDRSLEQKILDECIYKIYLMGGVDGRFYIEEFDRSEIPLCQLNSYENGTLISIPFLKEILQKAGWSIEERDFYGELSPCVIYKMEDCKSSCKTESECDADEYRNTEIDIQFKENNEDELSDWDDDLTNTPIKKQAESSNTQCRNISENARTSTECEDDLQEPPKFKVESCIELKLLPLVDGTGNKSQSPNIEPEFHAEVHPEAPFFEPNHPAEYREIREYQNVNPNPQPGIVENGDLANNNRDDEGNNYQPLFANDNERPEIGEAPVVGLPRLEADLPVKEADDDSDDEDQESDLKCLSKEALFDPNSVLSLLEDTDDASSIDDGIMSAEASRELQISSQNQVPFPRWLVDLLAVDDDDDDVVVDDDSQEPHFFCQGDGLGVHPVGEDLDDDDDSDTDTLSQNSMDEEAPTDGQPNVSESVTLANESDEYLEVVGRSIVDTDTLPALPNAVTTNNESYDEFFDTVENLNNSAPVNVNGDESAVFKTPSSSCNTTVTE